MGDVQCLRGDQQLNQKQNNESMSFRFELKDKFDISTLKVTEHK